MKQTLSGCSGSVLPRIQVVAVGVLLALVRQVLHNVYIYFWMCVYIRVHFQVVAIGVLVRLVLYICV